MLRLSWTGAARLKDMDKLGKQLKASESDRVALVELIQAHEKIFTGSLVGILRHRRRTKKRMSTKGVNDASPRQCADSQRLGVFTASQEIKDMSMKASGEKLPLISIIVPSFNQGRFLRETLDSIFRQNYPRLEVIVMDGGSTDESVDIIRSYENRLTYWQSRPDKGQTAAINEGVGRCTGELVAWLNSDDFYWKDSLWTVGRAYSAYPDRGLYIGNGLRYNQREGRYTPFCRRHLALNRDALINGLDYILQPASFFLRKAWQDVGGLMSDLNYCMDWDIVIRIADRYPAVLINEFLAVSREYEETKTGSGKMSRASEIVQMVEKHSEQEMTPGSLAYLLETLVDINADHSSASQLPQEYLEGIHDGIAFLQGVISKQFARQCGNSDGFPEAGDPQDSTYLPFARNGSGSQSVSSDFSTLPSISVITPSLNQAQFLEQSLLTVLNQNYPKLETIVIDGGSDDGSVEILKRYKNRLTYWMSEPDKGPAHAINKGFKRAKGEIIAWLNADDMYADEALWEAGKAFAEDPELDMILANALYIDENNHLFLADHGIYRTALYYGEMQSKERIPAYWRYIHAVPQPTVFFRKSLLDSCGNLNERYQYIFDFELFFRFAGTAKVKKIERTMAFYRIHLAAKTSDWNKFEIELYRFSRGWWPSIRYPEFWVVYQDFVANYMRRNFKSLSRGFRFWVIASIVGFSALTGIGNPERLKKYLSAPKQSGDKGSPCVTKELSSNGSVLPARSGAPSTSQTYHLHTVKSDSKYNTIFCSYTWPRHPGYSGGEIRDFQLVRHLIRRSAVDFFALYDCISDARDDILSSVVDKLHTPKNTRPEMVCRRSLWTKLKHKILSVLRSKNLPVLGCRYHNDTALGFNMIATYILAPLQERLAQKPPDFLFVSPQSNPVAMMLNMPEIDTRLIMASYDAEAVRMRRFAVSQGGMAKLALALEAKRAERFEKENLAFYDGIIAVSDLDKDIFVNEYGFPPERVVVIDNGVDPGYFAFTKRQPVERPEIVYTGSFSYLPNQQAAWRLIRGIMPIVWKKYPEARLWIVGQQPGPKLEAQSDGKRIVVTGRVEDIRPYLAGASVGCVPLLAGSGTKYKVLEALSAGMPLVCTPLSIEGLELEDGKHLLLGDDDKELAAALMRLLEKPELIKEITRQGNEWVKQRYAWDVILPRMDSWLDALRAMPLRRDGSGGGVA